MSFSYEENNLKWQSLNLAELCSEISADLEKVYNYRGAFFLYHEDILKERLQKLQTSLPGSHFYYSVKSLSNIEILKCIKQSEKFGLDVVSGGEVMRGILAGYDGSQMVFAGVGKTKEEIILGLQKDIKSFHVESVPELIQISSIAASIGKKARVAFRVNPDIKVKTHKYISTGQEENKFGLSGSEITAALETLTASSCLELTGLQIHLGSQLLDTKPYIKALNLLITLYEEFHDKTNCKIDYFSLGGGFGVDYETTRASSADFDLESLAKEIGKFKDLPCKIDFEPGRYISASIGILVCHILYIKNRSNLQIAISDAGMSELIRPALYDAIHPVMPLHRRSGRQKYNIVGPICESSDFLRLGIELPELKQNDSIAILHTGAYGSVMSSNYNSRPLIPEILSSNDGSFRVIRKPQSMQEILSLETSLS